MKTGKLIMQSKGRLASLNSFTSFKNGKPHPEGPFKAIPCKIPPTDKYTSIPGDHPFTPWLETGGKALALNPFSQG